MPVLVVGNTEIPYTIRTSARVRRRRIEVTPQGVTVVVPNADDVASVPAFVHAKRRWVFDKVAAVAEVAAARPQVTPASTVSASTSAWESGAKVLWRGRRLSLRVRSGAVEAPMVVFRSRFDVVLPAATNAEARPGLVRSALEGWMRDRALSEAKALVARFGRRAGATPRRVEVRPMVRFWGSCGRDRVIRLDADLLMRLPAHLAAYVAAHEVAHLVHRDHSPGFWRLLRSLLPDARARHDELLAHGRRL
jgi:predicted metal-dependent hydrolase